MDATDRTSRNGQLQPVPPTADEATASDAPDAAATTRTAPGAVSARPPSPEDLERMLGDLHAATFGWAMSCCRYDREEASDVLQASYLKVLEAKARFDGRSSFKTWVFGVVRRTAAERRRRRIVREIALARWSLRSGPPEPPRAPETADEEERLVRTLRVHLRRLSRRQRELLHLVFYEEMTIEEASRTLGVSVGTARVHYERGKAALKAMLGAPMIEMNSDAVGQSRRLENVHEQRERHGSGNPRAVQGCAAGGREIGS